MAFDLTGKRALVMGVANDHSIAWGIARALHAAGMHPIMVPDLLEPTKEMHMLATQILPSLTAVRDYLDQALAW